jgi:hypothetical protein
MIKGNMHILLEYETLQEDINELKIMTFGDNLATCVKTELIDNSGFFITLIYSDIDCYKYKAKKVNAGLLIEEEPLYFSFRY